MNKVFTYDTKVIVMTPVTRIRGKYPSSPLPGYMLNDINANNTVGATEWRLLRNLKKVGRIYTYTNPTTGHGYKVSVFLR